jgi:Leucine-rich repeat (LRR) protein
MKIIFFFSCCLTSFLTGNNLTSFSDNPTDTLRSGNYYFINGNVYDSSKENLIIESNILEAVITTYGYLLVRKADKIAFANERFDTGEWTSININGTQSMEFELDGDALYVKVYTLSDTIIIDLMEKRPTKVPIGSEWIRSIEEVESNSTIFRLNLSNKNLIQIPEQVTELKNLAELVIYNCSISSFPIEFFKLKNLEELCMSDNQLYHIPKQIELLSNLYKLDFRHNQLKDLPIEIKNLKNLMEIDLRGNAFNYEERRKIKDWFKGTACIVLFDD